MKNFTFFNNEQGSYTIVYDLDGSNETIISIERGKKNAIEVCKRLNDILFLPICEHIIAANLIDGKCLKCNKEVAKTITNTVNYKSEDYDVWYKLCEKCGYDTGKSTIPKDGNKTCWRCGNFITRDYSPRALKLEVFNNQKRIEPISDIETNELIDKAIKVVKS